MPFYEYVCTECGEPTELLQKLSDPPATECPSCHSQALIKQISAAGFRLKGSGWYETDFKSGEKRNLVGDSAEPRIDTGDAKSSLKTDAKPDAKTASGEGSAKSDTSSGGDKSAKSDGGDAKAAAKPKASAKPEAAAKPATKSTDGSKTAA